MDINKLNIEQLVRYINMKLSENESLSVNKLCDKIDIKRSTLKSRLSKANYIFNMEHRQYIKDDKSSIKVKHEVIATKIDNDDRPNTEVMQQIELTDDSNTLVIDDKIKDNLIGLANNYDRIMSLIDGYDRKYDKEYDGISIELPIETIKDFRTTIRVNNVVWEQFKEFSQEHKEFTQRDLLSMALLDYINKNKK